MGMTEEDYQKLLDRAIAQLPQESMNKDRFEIPEPVSSVSGSRTSLYNSKEICDRLKRDRNHLSKFLAGELATSATIDKERTIFQGQFDNKILGQLIERYVNEFVLCPVCHKPETRIVRKERIYFLICDACGAASSIKNI